MIKDSVSEREFELTEPLAFGASKKMIAAKFHLSIYTVETTVKNVYAKIGASNLAEYIMWYYAVTFDMAKEINEKKKEVLSIIGLVVCLHYSFGEINMRRNNTRNMQDQSSLVTRSRLRSRRRERAIPLSDFYNHNTISA